MKKYFIILLLAMLFMACNEDKTVDVTVMPEETTIGAQTFGCLVDGWLYVGGRYSDVSYTFSPQPSIYFVYNAVAKEMRVEVKVKEKGEGYEYLSFTINNPVENQKTTFTNAKWLDKTESLTEKDLGSGTGTVEITRFDTTEKIISGRFYSGGNQPISHGQFDVKYK